VSEVAPVPPLATGSVPVTSEVKLTFPAVNAEVPLALTTPVNVVAPVPPLATAKVPVPISDALIAPSASTLPLLTVSASILVLDINFSY
jgi:hypothetical protein